MPDFDNLSPDELERLRKVIEKTSPVTVQLSLSRGEYGRVVLAGTWTLLILDMIGGGALAAGVGVLLHRASRRRNAERL